MKTLIAALIVSTSFIASSVSAEAQVDSANTQTQKFDIPAGDMKGVLDKFARQSGRQILYRIEDVRGVRSHGVHGRMTSDRALAKILMESKLEARAEEGGPIAIVRSSSTKVAHIDAPQPSPDEIPASSSGLGEIVVTAQKSSENLQKAAASIVTVAGMELQQRGISDVQSLSKVLPSVNLRNDGAGTIVFIRGIGTRVSTPAYASASSFLYNGIVVERRGSFGLTYDLERVESMSGPQGTLYGGSAAGGLINLISAKPKGNSSGYVIGEFGDYDTVHLTAAQNVQLMDGFDLRGAIDYYRRDSYYNNGLNSRDYWSGHLAASIEPVDGVKAHIFYTHGHETGLPITTLVTNPPADPKHPFDLPAFGVAGNSIDPNETRQNNKNDIVGANIDLRLGRGTLTYIPAYVYFDTYNRNYSGNLGYLIEVYDHQKQFSQELRWSGDFGPAKITVGGFYNKTWTKWRLAQTRYTSPADSVLIPLQNYKENTLSYAAFAQVVMSVSDRLRLTAGGRYTHDEVRAYGTGAGGVPLNFQHAAGRPDYKLGLDYDLADHVLVYANLQSGYIRFGFNDAAVNEVLPTSKLTALSMGIKSRFANDRLQANIEAYRYLYRDFQATLFFNQTGLTSALNAEKAVIWGIDINLRALITPSLSLYASLVPQRARYENFEGPGYNYSGNQMVHAPDFNFQGGIEKKFFLANDAKITARADFQYSASYYGGFPNFPTQQQPAYHRTDLSLAYAPSGNRWNAEIFVRNVEDSTVFTTIAGGSATSPGTSGLEPPRTFGIRISANW